MIAGKVGLFEGDDDGFMLREGVNVGTAEGMLLVGLDVGSMHEIEKRNDQLIV